MELNLVIERILNGFVVIDTKNPKGMTYYKTINEIFNAHTSGEITERDEYFKHSDANSERITIHIRIEDIE